MASGPGFMSPPGASQVLPPSLDRWMTCPNQPLDCDAYRRLGSTGDPLMWYISQPAKCGPLTSHFSRLPSDVRINAPLRVPTKTRTLLILAPSYSYCGCFHGIDVRAASKSTCLRKKCRHRVWRARGGSRAQGRILREMEPRGNDLPAPSPSRSATRSRRPGPRLPPANRGARP